VLGKELPVSILLSILVPTVPSRISTFYPAMIANLLKQIGDRKDIEVIGLFDNKMRSTGSKRNAMLNLASGKYLVFLDDDDYVTEDWLSRVVSAVESNPDLIVYGVLVHWPDGRLQHCRYDVSVKECRDIDRDHYEGHPSHVHVWRTCIAKSVGFSDKQFGEDTEWSSTAAKSVQSQVTIDKELYHYCFNPKTSETRK
jgi:glycosyltransferase involved in cell wall biosynthesis